MGDKKEHLGRRVVAAARSGDRFNDVHVVFGGTGAVGGAALLRLLLLYEEMIAVQAPPPDAVPRLIATGVGADLDWFPRRLSRLVESRHGSGARLTRVRDGYLTSSGVFLVGEPFSLAPMPGLHKVASATPARRETERKVFLASLGVDLAGSADSIVDAMERRVAELRPFSDYLLAYREQHLDDRTRFRSVLVCIPIATLAAYGPALQLALGAAAKHDAAAEQRLQLCFLQAIRDDLVHVQATLADAVLVAHTTGVGGMFDEEPGDAAEAPPSIRLGFAHSAQDESLRVKAVLAKKLTALYAESGIRTLVTAAAVGIDEVRLGIDIRRPSDQLPLQRRITELLNAVDHKLVRGRIQPKVGDVQHLCIFPPQMFEFDNAEDPDVQDLPSLIPATLDQVEPLIPTYTMRSGENGFFSVANADALYRVMRVASASEIGLVLATVALFGEDRITPWFPDNVCYYTETDNSRYVLDFLAQPALRATQLSGLEPMALQDLGAAKHQGELHTLALLILIHRLRNLDTDALDPYTDVRKFDARRFFIEQSRPLTFEDIEKWDARALAADLEVLAAASRPEDLLSLIRPRDYDLFPARRAALLAVLREVVRAVWQIPCLGSPIVFNRQGRSVIRCGYYIAPLELLVTNAQSVNDRLRALFDEKQRSYSFGTFRDQYVCVNGFIDLRPHAIVSTAWSAETDLTNAVARFTDVDRLASHLQSLEPGSFFATCGIDATLYRLRALYRTLREAMLELGTFHDFRWEMPRDLNGHILVVPGIVEAHRMMSEGLEKTTGTERIAGEWGYASPIPPRRSDAIMEAIRVE